MIGRSRSTVADLVLVDGLGESAFLVIGCLEDGEGARVAGRGDEGMTGSGKEMESGLGEVELRFVISRCRGVLSGAILMFLYGVAFAMSFCLLMNSRATIVVGNCISRGQ